MKKSKSWTLIIVLLIFVWPVGLFFLIQKLRDDKTAVFEKSSTLKYISFALMGFGVISIFMTLTGQMTQTVDGVKTVVTGSDMLFYIAVSYTHLDVYKRQIMSNECNHDCGACQEECDEKSFLAPRNAHSHVKKVIGIVSGKGGVGKSSITSLLAVLKKREGHNVAISVSYTHLYKKFIQCIILNTELPYFVLHQDCKWQQDLLLMLDKLFSILQKYGLVPSYYCEYPTLPFQNEDIEIVCYEMEIQSICLLYTSRCV